jgi:hypothetical protein
MPQSAGQPRALAPNLSVQFPQNKRRWGRRADGSSGYGLQATLHIPRLDHFGLGPFWTFRLTLPSTLRVEAPYSQQLSLQPSRLAVGVVSPHVPPVRLRLDSAGRVATAQIELGPERFDLEERRGHITCYIEEQAVGSP